MLVSYMALCPASNNVLHCLARRGFLFEIVDFGFQCFVFRHFVFQPFDSKICRAHHRSSACSRRINGAAPVDVGDDSRALFVEARIVAQRHHFDAIRGDPVLRQDALAFDDNPHGKNAIRMKQLRHVDFICPRKLRKLREKRQSAPQNPVWIQRVWPD